MHYRNGRPAKNGDKVLLLPPYGSPAVGVLFDAKADGGNDCNGSLAPLNSFGQIYSADLKYCLHLDDVMAIGDKIPDTSGDSGNTCGCKNN